MMSPRRAAGGERREDKKKEHESDCFFFFFFSFAHVFALKPKHRELADCLKVLLLSGLLCD